MKKTFKPSRKSQKCASKKYTKSWLKAVALTDLIFLAECSGNYVEVPDPDNPGETKSQGGEPYTTGHAMQEGLDECPENPYDCGRLCTALLCCPGDSSLVVNEGTDGYDDDAHCVCNDPPHAQVAGEFNVGNCCLDDFNFTDPPRLMCGPPEYTGGCTTTITYGESDYIMCDDTPCGTCACQVPACTPPYPC